MKVINKDEMYKILTITITILKVVSFCSSYLGGSVYASTFNILQWEFGVKQGFLWYNGIIGFVYMVALMIITVNYKEKDKEYKAPIEKEPFTPRKFK